MLVNRVINPCIAPVVSPYIDVSNNLPEFKIVFATLLITLIIFAAINKA